MSYRAVSDSVHWFIAELTSRVIAETGIPSDRHHVGKIMLRSLKDDPNFVLQTDGATGESETSGSVLERSVRCASSFRNLGLQVGDVVVLMGPNHLDLCIPYYACLYLGVAAATIDNTLGLVELRGSLDLNRPKIIFCQNERLPDVESVVNELELKTKIVTFDKGEKYINFKDFLDKHSGDTTVESFKANDFDPAETIAFLIGTSGTTGLPKAAAVTHKNVMSAPPYLWSRAIKFPGPTRLCFAVSPLQWLTSIMNFVLSAILRYPRVQTSAPLTPEHACYIINTYKPSYAMISPTMMATLMKQSEGNRCDFTCFERLMISGSALLKDLVDEVKKITPNTEVINAFGLSETSAPCFHGGDNAPPESCGKRMANFQYRLIDVETLQDIEEPNKPGELWVKGPGVFKGYYKNPEATAECFAEDGWFKTGDMLYRDENFTYFFVDRIKLLLKYKNYQISPVELEKVIRQHPGVLDVAVTGIPDEECGDLPVACVVPRPGYNVTAQEIKDLVTETLSDAKQLRGGVIFLSEIPMTVTTKMHRRKLKEIALQMKRE